ncbi:MAG: 4-hydroxy-tetrahydrodipicolinate reductase [Xanthomonadales bacterium]|nr:4-hydroxy-tetrahydrodipicolinate reductase [Xanthomonadales bacterium]
MTAATRIVLFGASGRMGQEILRLVPNEPGISVVSALVRPGSVLDGEPVWPGRTSSLVYERTLEPEQQGEVLVDFSSPASFDAALALAVEREMAFVSGTTGLSDAQHDELESAAQRIPVLWSANFSIGVALLRRLALEAASLLGEDFDIEIIEAHHRLKRDAPSGTALALGRAIADCRGRSLDEVGAFVRHGKDTQRRRGEIGFASVRGGDVVGDHTVLFAGDGERLELTHRAGTRALFARGALLAARWIVGRSAGKSTLDQAVAAAAPD